MNQSRNKNIFKGLCRTAIAVVAIGIAAAPVIHAKPKSKSREGNLTNVVAHVELAGGPVTRMLLVQKSGKEYLLLGLDSSERVAILDVSEPGKPRAIDATAPAQSPATEVKLVADTLTLFGRSDTETTAPSSPKEIRNLTGVTAFMKDKAHGLIYVTNGDGLWIVKTKQKADADATPDYYGG